MKPQSEMCDCWRQWEWGIMISELMICDNVGTINYGRPVSG